MITTGGLGPTVDDPTREAVAAATDRELGPMRRTSGRLSWIGLKSMGERLRRTTAVRHTFPKTPVKIENPVGTAPCFIVDLGNACVVSLPGVPSEMKFVLHQSIIPYLKKKFELKSRVIKATVLHAATIGESAIDELIGDLEKYSNPTVGLLAHPGQVDVRVTAKASSTEEAEALTKPVVEELFHRLGNNIYGRGWRDPAKRNRQTGKSPGAQPGRRGIRPRRHSDRTIALRQAGTFQELHPG